MRIAVAEAKAQFAELLRRAEAGEEVEITRYGRPVARLVGSGPGPRKSLVGALRGRIAIAPDFDELPQGFFDALAAPVEPATTREPERTTDRLPK
jgi:prevent-host-death family protein